MDETLSLAAIARLIAADILRAHPPLGSGGAEDLRHRLETALRTAVREERLACAAECERRRTLWTETEQRASTPPGLRSRHGVARTRRRSSPTPSGRARHPDGDGCA